MDGFIATMCNEDHLVRNRDRENSLLAMVGGLYSRINDGYFGIIFSEKGGSGKTTLAKLLKRISP